VTTGHPEVIPRGRKGSLSAASHRKVLIILVGLLLGMLMSSLDQTILATALPTVASEFGGLDQLTWIVTAYLITSAASMPIYGKLGDLYGRKNIYLGALALFLLGSILSGLSQTVAELVVFRAFQGLGAGGLLVLPMAILGDVLSARDRGRYQGYVVGTVAVSNVLGPLIGGVLTSHLSWRWCFYINVPIGIVAIMVTWRTMRLPSSRIRHRIDYLGMALLTSAVTCALFLSVIANTARAWSSPVIVMLAVATILLACAFILQEHHTLDPLIPLRLFSDPIFRVTSVVGFTTGLTLLGATFYLPVFLQLVTGADPTLSGLLIIPYLLGLLLASFLTGQTIARTGRYRLQTLFGAALMVIGSLVLTTIGPDSGTWHNTSGMVLLGSGVGMIYPVLTIAVQNAVPVRDLGTATSANFFFRSLGGTAGVALFGAILSAHSGAGHGASTITAAQIRALAAPARAALAAAFTEGTDEIFLVATVISVLTLIALFWLREIPLRTAAHVAVMDAVVGTGDRLAVETD
jgi:EmrB/QacA subfamily drug resistance transporter